MCLEGSAHCTFLEHETVVMVCTVENCTKVGKQSIKEHIHSKYLRGIVDLGVVDGRAVLP